MKGLPFAVRNTACPGVWGDHLITSDGAEWAYAEALCESNYPAVRVNRDGDVLADDLVAARSYWRVYRDAIEDVKERSKKDASGGKGIR